MTLRKPGQTPVGMIEGHPFQILLPQHTELLRRRALKLTGNAHRAEDLVQDTLLKAWAARDSFRPDSRLGSWLFTILRNTFFSDLRKSRREVEDIDDVRARALSEEPPPGTCACAEGTCVRHRAAALRAAARARPDGGIRVLTTRGRQGLWLHHRHDQEPCQPGQGDALPGHRA